MDSNTILGANALGNGNNLISYLNTAIGMDTGLTCCGGYRNTFLGYSADVSIPGICNSTAIGASARVETSNQIKLGTSMETVKIDGSLNVMGGTTINDTLNVIGYGVVTNLNVRENAVITGSVSANGYRCKNGLTGKYGVNYMNSYWTGTTLQFYADANLLGSSFSDYRSKTNVADASGVLDRVCALKMFNYNYTDVGIVKGDDKLRLGFYAHELQEALPEYADVLVNGEKDAVDEGGSPILQSINNMDTVLLKAIQELNVKVEQQQKIIDMLLSHITK